MPTLSAHRRGPALGRLGIVHPLPSLINGLLVVTLAALAGAGIEEVFMLGVAMLGFQGSIGALNDAVDVDRDRLAKPDKPIPAGDFDRRGALVVALVGGAIGITISAAHGPAVLLAGALGYGCGLAYDLGLRERGLGWACFAVAFPLLLAWTWLAAAGSLPPSWALLVPLAALAGPAIHLANSLADVDADIRADVPSLARSLGRARAVRILAILTSIVQLLAWAILLSEGASVATIVIAAAALRCWAGSGWASRGRAETEPHRPAGRSRPSRWRSSRSPGQSASRDDAGA